MDEFLLQRKYPETPPSPRDHRHPTERDRDRILHSSAFRRLQGKTQVFGIGQADFYRTRLTHSVEAAQIARGIAQNLLYENPLLQRCLVPELAEAAALAHDLGHPPFGHAGEQTLDACMREVSSRARLTGKKVLRFEGNAQTFHILVAAELVGANSGLGFLINTAALGVRWVESYKLGYGYYVLDYCD